MRLALSAVGGGIGALFGGFGGFSWGWAAGSFLGGILFPETVKTKGPRLNDLKVSASTYGLPLQRVWGTARVPTNMFWSLDIREKKKTTTEGGLLGKGGGMSQTLVTYTYFLTAAYMIGEPCDAIIRIWANKKVIYDPRPGQKVLKKYKKMEVRFYNGAEDQLPDPDMQAEQGVDVTPAYRGVSYVLIKDCLWPILATLPCKSKLRRLERHRR
jgi:hypothetical protein